MIQQHPDDDALTLAAVAALLGGTPRVIAGLYRDGLLPPPAGGRPPTWNRGAVEDWIDGLPPAPPPTNSPQPPTSENR